MGRHQTAESFHLRLAGVHRCPNSRDVAFDQDGDVSTTELFARQDLYRSGFQHRVDGFEDGGKTLRFDETHGKTELIAHIFLGYQDGWLFDERAEVRPRLVSGWGKLGRSGDDVHDGFAWRQLYLRLRVRRIQYFRAPRKVSCIRPDCR